MLISFLNSLWRNALQSPGPSAASGLPPSITYQTLATAHCESCRKYPTCTWTTTSLQTNQEIFQPHARLFGLIAGVPSLSKCRHYSLRKQTRLEPGRFISQDPLGSQQEHVFKKVPGSGNPPATLVASLLPCCYRRKGHFASPKAVPIQSTRHPVSGSLWSHHPCPN